MSRGRAALKRPTEFGGILTRHREAHGISQERLAKLAASCPSYISRIETGARNPSPEYVERIIAILDLNQREANVFRLAAGFAPVHTKGIRP